jgi:hypothetical protein
MRQVRLSRIETNPKHGTFGVLVVDGEAFCVTLEPYSRNNVTSISSINAGQYLCTVVDSPRWGHTYTVTNVEGRDLIRIHAGNIDDNTEGCIIIAQYFGKLRGNRAVLNSGNTHKAFMKLMNDEPFILTITENY